MIKAGEVFLVAYDGDSDGMYINLALSDCDYFDKDFQVQQLWPETLNPTTETSVGKEDIFTIINPAELLTSLLALQKSHPELFL